MALLVEDKSHLKIAPADYVEDRGGRRLLIWKDIPHWMVVDGELYEFLLKIDGREPLKAVLARYGFSWGAAARDFQSVAQTRPAGSFV